MADVEINEGLTVPSMPSAPSPELDVGSGTAKTITPSLTVMAMPSAPAYSLLLVYERYQTGNDSALAIGGDAWEAQSFAPAAGHTVNSLGGRFYRTGAPGTVTLELYSADDGEGADGGPTGAALGSATFDGDGLTTATTGQWVNPKMAAGVALTQDAPYAVVVKAASPAAAAADSWKSMGSVTATSSSTVRTYGWRFQVSAAVNVTHLTVYAYYTTTYTLHLWRSSDKALLATKTVEATANTWATVALDSPIALTAATDYVVSTNKVASGNYMRRRAAPAAAEFDTLVSFVDGRYSAGADTYPETVTDTNAWGICGFLLSGTAVSKVYWLADVSTPAYASGQRWYSTNGGTSYTGDAAKDFLFEEGIIQLAEEPAEPITLAGRSATGSRAAVTLDVGITLAARSATGSRAAAALDTVITLAGRSATGSRADAELTIPAGEPITLAGRSATGSRADATLDVGVAIAARSATGSRAAATLDVGVTLAARSATGSRAALALDSAITLAGRSATGSRADATLDTNVTLAGRFASGSRAAATLDVGVTLAARSATGSRGDLALDTAITLAGRSATGSRADVALSMATTLAGRSATGSRAYLFLLINYLAPTNATVTSSAHTAASITSATPTAAAITSSAHTSATVTPPATLATVTSKTPTKAVVG